MEIPKAHNLWLPYLTLVVALLLRTIHLPGVAVYGAPDWVALVLLYWVLAIPYRFGILFAFFVGLVVDVHGGTPLGLNGLALAFVAYAALVLHQRIRIYPPVQQAGMVFLILAAYLVIKHSLRSFIGLSPDQSVLYLVPAVTSALFWPLIYLLLRGLRIRYRVK